MPTKPVKPRVTTNFRKKEYKPLAPCGNLNTPYAIRALMRRVTTHHLAGELSPQAQSAINGSANIALKTLQQGEYEDRVRLLEEKLQMAMDILAGKDKKSLKRKKKGKHKSKKIQPDGIPV